MNFKEWPYNAQAPSQEPDWEAIAADQAMTIALMQAELAALKAPSQGSYGNTPYDEATFAVTAPSQEPVITDHEGRPMTYWGGKAAPSQEPVALTEEMMERIEQIASASFKHHRASVRGQQITMWDNYEPHIAAATLSIVASPNAAQIAGLEGEVAAWKDAAIAAGARATGLQAELDALKSSSQYQHDYTWATVEDYEKDFGNPVNDAFRIGWVMARTTNSFLEQLGDGESIERAESAPSQEPDFASEDVQRFAIQVEKRLCELLDWQWRPSGMSIETLCVEIAKRMTAPSREPDFLIPLIRKLQTELTALNALNAPSQEPAAFAEWFRREMPAGTVIGDPEWWIPRILRAAQAIAAIDEVLGEKK